MYRKTLYVIAILFLRSLAKADTGFSSTVRVSDSGGSPACTVGQIKVSPGTLACNGQVATVTTGGGSTTNTFASSVTFKSQIVIAGGENYGSINTVSANYTATSTDTVIVCNAASGAITITLDAANVLTPNGQKLYIVKSDTSANACTIKAAGTDKILYTTGTITLNGQGHSIKILSDASANWMAPDGFSATPPFIGYKSGPSAAQAVAAASSTKCTDIYANSPFRATGVRFLVGAQSGSMQVSLLDSLGIALAVSNETITPALGQQTMSFTSAVNAPPGAYKICLGADNATATFTKSSGNESIGCNDFNGSLPLSVGTKLTPPGSLSSNCFNTVLIVTGGITQ